MFDMWSEELSDEQRDALIDKAVQEVRRRKMEAPAIMFLESHKPLAGIGGHAALVFSPFLVPFLGFDNVNNYSRLFSKRENIEMLLQRLEEKPEENKDAKEAPCNT